MSATAERSPLRVHVVIDSMGPGGAELLLSEFAVGAPAAGIELSVSYLGDRDAEPALDRLRALGIEPVRIGLDRLASRGAVARLRAAMRAHGAELVHTHLAYSDALGGVAARSLGLPWVSTIHVMHVEPGWREAVRERAIGALRAACASRTIFVSDAARTQYRERAPWAARRAATVHNGVLAEPRPGTGSAVRAELGIPAGDLVVGMLSVLRPGKGHELAIEALRAVRERLPNARLLIVGDGPRRGAIERLAAADGDRVVFAGYRADAMTVLDSVDLLLHPSSFDAFPTALLEAMSAGVPVVASAVGGIPEIVSDGVTGVLVAPDDAGALVGPVAGLLADSGRRSELAAAGRRRFEERFTVADWALRTRAVYDAVAAERSGRRR